jgi:hypothetical protein
MPSRKGSANGSKCPSVVTVRNERADNRHGNHLFRRILCCAENKLALKLNPITSAIGRQQTIARTAPF